MPKVIPHSRCPWAVKPLDIAYHDTEWGVPLHDDRALFELLILEGARAVAYPGDPLHANPARAMPGPTRLIFRDGRFEPFGTFEDYFKD